MSQEPGEESLFIGFSEFGVALAEFVRAEPSARGAIVTDNDGDPVDYAHRHGAVTPLDLQIAGAQAEQATTRTAAWCARQGLGACEILVEASHGLLLSAVPGQGFVLSSLHELPAPVAAEPLKPGPNEAEAVDEVEPGDDRVALLRRFADLRGRIGALLT